MIMGIGVDMVSEARVARSIKRPGFLEKVYGPAGSALLLEGRACARRRRRPILPQRKPLARHLAQGFLREFALCEGRGAADENGAPYFFLFRPGGGADAGARPDGASFADPRGGTAAAFVVLERREASASLKEEPECSTLR